MRLQSTGRRQNRAFTLIELLVVIIVMGVLAAIAWPTFQSLINRSEDSAAEQTALAFGRSAVATAAFDRKTVFQDAGGADLEEGDNVEDSAASQAWTEKPTVIERAEITVLPDATADPVVNGEIEVDVDDGQCKTVTLEFTPGVNASFAKKGDPAPC